MASLVSPVLHAYTGKTDVYFDVAEDGGLSVTIDTERLHIRSVESTPHDHTSYAALFGDRDVMRTFADGTTRTKEQIKTSIDTRWAKRWKENDPYSALAVFKNDTDEFAGHVVLGHGDNPGESEIAYLFMKNCWKQGFGTEAVTSVVREYAPATVAKGYTLGGEPLTKIVATARTDNTGSCKILEKVGMRQTGIEEKFGSERCFYAIELKDIQKKV